MDPNTNFSVSAEIHKAAETNVNRRPLSDGVVGKTVSAKAGRAAIDNFFRAAAGEVHEDNGRRAGGSKAKARGRFDAECDEPLEFAGDMVDAGQIDIDQLADIVDGDEDRVQQILADPGMATEEEDKLLVRYLKKRNRRFR